MSTVDGLFPVSIPSMGNKEMKRRLQFQVNCISSILQEVNDSSISFYRRVTDVIGTPAPKANAQKKVSPSTLDSPPSEK